MARSRRRTSSRLSTGKKKRKISVIDLKEEDKRPVADNWYFQQSPVAQVYYAKVAFGVVSGLILGIFFIFVDFFAKNWFMFPILGVILIAIVARRFLDIDKDTITDLKLYAWTGTISLFIGFITSSSLMYMLLKSPPVVF